MKETVNRLVTWAWFLVGSRYTSFKITVLILYTSQGKVILLKTNSGTSYNPTDDSKTSNIQSCQPDVAQQNFLPYYVYVKYVVCLPTGKQPLPN